MFYYWLQQLRSGDPSLDDVSRPGRSKDEANESNDARVAINHRIPAKELETKFIVSRNCDTETRHRVA